MINHSHIVAKKTVETFSCSYQEASSTLDISHIKRFMRLDLSINFDSSWSIWCCNTCSAFFSSFENFHYSALQSTCMVDHQYLLAYIHVVFFYFPALQKEQIQHHLTVYCYYQLKTSSVSWHSVNTERLNYKNKCIAVKTWNKKIKRTHKARLSGNKMWEAACVQGGNCLRKIMDFLIIYQELNLKQVFIFFQFYF